MNLSWIYENPLVRKYMPEEFHFSHPEVTLLFLGKQLMISQCLDNNSQVGSILLFGLGVDQDVIDKHGKKIIQV